MDRGCSDRGQLFPFPCQLRSKHQDTGCYFSSTSGPEIPISEKRKRAPALLPLFLPTSLLPGPAPHRPVLCPLTFITHFLFMLGRNCGCSWWFEVRRDWPRVTLNKYTRTSQEGTGKLRLPPNHPWLISWQIQGDFLCTLPTTTTATIPSPDWPPSLPQLPKPRRVMESGRHGQDEAGRWSIATQSYLCSKNACNKHAHVYAERHEQMWLLTAPRHGSSDQLLKLVVSY